MKLATLVLGTMISLGGVAAADPPAPRAHVRQALLQAFDRDGDGHLDPQERRRASRVLRRIARRLARGGRHDGMRQRMIERYDRNGDGNVGPREMPPAAADDARRFDRDGNGWIDPGE
jgi:hypothetical protein